jgi:succinate--hydroxymethylglutarate CoA-transferase
LGPTIREIQRRIRQRRHRRERVFLLSTQPHLSFLSTLQLTTTVQVNRNKKSLGLSFQHKSGVEILHKLAAESDILVENYLPGTLKKYGMDYETLHKLNPRLIYASITGYGQTGPYSNRAGYDVMVEAEMGLMHITGSRDGPPVKVGVAVTDLTTGLYASNSIMAAIIGRAKTGRGQHIDVALSDCQVATLANMASSCLISGEKDQGRWGTAHRRLSPHSITLHLILTNI